MSNGGHIQKLVVIDFSIPPDEAFQNELFAGLASDAPRELSEALASSGNMHNPKIQQLWKPFKKALLATPTINKLGASLAVHGLTISRVSCEKFSLISTLTNPKRHFFGTVWLDVIKSGSNNDSDRAEAVFDHPSSLFPHSFLPALAHFEKAKVETTLRGFYLRADTFPGFNREHDPSAAGIYLNVAVRDPQEIPYFKDASTVVGEVTERTVEFPEPEKARVALRVVFKFGSHANPDAIKAISNDIEEVINQAPTHPPR
jgi:hypothetical protein